MRGQQICLTGVRVASQFHIHDADRLPAETHDNIPRVCMRQLVVSFDPTLQYLLSLADVHPGKPSCSLRTPTAPRRVPLGLTLTTFGCFATIYLSLSIFRPPLSPITSILTTERLQTTRRSRARTRLRHTSRSPNPLLSEVIPSIYSCRRHHV